MQPAKAAGGWRKGVVYLALVLGALQVTPARGQDRPKIEPPQILEFVEAEFPEEERERGEDASVLLQIAISAEGEVVGVAVVESAGPAFDQAAVEAIQQFRFEPARMDGKPIPVKIDYRYEFTWREELEERTTADLVGRVMDRGTGQPLTGVTVRLDDGTEVTTDETGRFELMDVAPGDRTLTLSGEGLTPVAAQEALEAGRRIEVIYELDFRQEEDDDDDDVDFEFVVTAPRIQRQIVSTEVVAAQGKRIPGTQGDVLKVVENLPGVARAAAGSAALVVWGAAPEDTRVYVDGMRIPRLYHDGGYRSVMHSDNVRSVELVPGGYAPTYGRGLGGIVKVRQRPLDEDGVHGSLAVDLLDAQGAIRAKVGERTHVAAAFRHSHLHWVLEKVAREDVGDIIPIPRYHDGQVRVVHHLNANESVEVGGMLSSDRIDRTVVASDPTLTARDSRSVGFYRAYMRYDKRSRSDGNISLLAFYGKDQTRIDNVFGGIPTFVSNDSNVFGLRGSWKAQLSDMVATEVGIDGDFTTSSLSRFGSIGAPPREGDARVFGQPPSGQLAADDWNTVMGSFGVYALVDFNFFDEKLHIIPGFRFEPYITMTDRLTPRTGRNPPVGHQRFDLALEPRVSLIYNATSKLAFKAAFGIYHQQPFAEDLSAVFGNPTLGLSRAQHYLTGASYKVTDSLDVELNAFLSRSDSLVWRSVAAQPFLAQALGQEGVGRSYGAQVLIRQQQVGRFFGWLSYTLMRSERRDAPDLRWRLFDFDQTHVLTAVGSVDLGKGWEVGTRLRFASGFPRTPVTGAYYDATADRYEPLFGDRNTIRIPAFFSMDVRGSKTFKLGDAIEGEVYLEVQNILNRRNPEEIVFNPSYTQQDYITGFPVLPIIGVSASW
jgi:TonB family protein